MPKLRALVGVVTPMPTFPEVALTYNLPELREKFPVPVLIATAEVVVVLPMVTV